MTAKNKKAFDFNEFLTLPWVLWAISITTSVMMWVYVTGMDESEYLTRKFSCPLEYRGLDSQTILRGRLSEVDVEIRGPEETILRLDYDSISTYVDARSFVPGKRYTQNVEVANLPSDVNLISISPSQVVLDLVRQVTRLINVDVILPQDIPEGQYIEGVEITPKEINVKGAEDDVVKIGSLRITPTIEELQNMREVLMMPVKVHQSEAFEGTVTLEPPQVRFKATLARGLPKKRVPVNVRFTGALDGDHEIKSTVTEPSEVQIEGEREKLDLIDAVDTEAVDISSFNSTQVVVVPLKNPDVEGVTIVNGSSIKLSVQIGDVRAEKKLTSIPIEIRNADNMQNLRTEPKSVTVTVEGVPSKIENFSPEETGLKIFADMSNIFMTPVTLPLRAEMISGDDFRIVRVEPQNVNIDSVNLK